ncbi:uncharacterized protein EI90DRAFT_2928474, partial [Cantharellus anzutake]|uniref:uncharacterized protein n=1 Tax=Cantharellus anzutake TaxID=1750568 RepID=UPI001903C0AF
HPGSLYAFGISAGARHSRKFGHTKFAKQSKYTDSELRESDHDLLGLASLAWAIIMSWLPVEIIKEFADGLEDSGVPALFLPSIESGSKGYYFPFRGKLYQFHDEPHPPPEIYYAQNYTVYVILPSFCTVAFPTNCCS